ncbi:MAG: hypothetical protein O2897_05155, partial [bacterium]|nr:hypothetical protein [bacterium]
MLFRILLILIGLQATSFFAYAKPVELCLKQENSKRCFGEHLFTIPFGYASPLMGTNISSSLNAQKNLETDSRLEQQIKHGALGGGIKFDLQVGILNWLAAFGNISGGVFLGNGLDFYKLGVGLKYDYDLGVKFRLWQNKRFMLSTAVSFLGNGFSGVVPKNIQSKIFDIQKEFPECSAISSAKTRAAFNVSREACDKIK